MAIQVGDDPNHTQMLQWIIGIFIATFIAVGGSMLAIVSRMIRGKKNVKECDLIHGSIEEKLKDIKRDLDAGKNEFRDARGKMESMDKTLVEISTILKERNKVETDRYDLHSDRWKKE